jgi:hypothetical protein
VVYSSAYWGEEGGRTSPAQPTGLLDLQALLCVHILAVVETMEVRVGTSRKTISQ